MEEPFDVDFDESNRNPDEDYEEFYEGYEDSDDICLNIDLKGKQPFGGRTLKFNLFLRIFMILISTVLVTEL